MAGVWRRLVGLSQCARTGPCPRVRAEEIRLAHVGAGGSALAAATTSGEVVTYDLGDGGRVSDVLECHSTDVNRCAGCTRALLQRSRRSPRLASLFHLDASEATLVTGSDDCEIVRAAAAAVGANAFFVKVLLTRALHYLGSLTPGERPPLRSACGTGGRAVRNRCARDREGAANTKASRSAQAGTLLGHSDGVTCVDARGDGVYLLSTDQTVKLWDCRRA